MAIKYIDAEYDDAKSKYYYHCPFCMDNIYLEGDVGCMHVIFSYETVNLQLLGEHEKIIEIAYSFVTNSPGGYIESYDDYDWDEEDIKLNEIFSFNDLVNIFENTDLKSLIPSLTVAQIVDPFIGGTYYVLASDEDLKRINNWGT